MTREIKFRAWDKSDQMMKYSDGYESLGSFFNLKEHRESFGVKYELMQYTGLTDKNGKKIFEGDILQFSDRWEWFRGKYYWKLTFAKNEEERKKIEKELEEEELEKRIVKLPEDYNWLLLSEIEQYWEAIGNIYENPELAEKIK